MNEGALRGRSLAATLPARALRYLQTHTGVHLSVEFRDLKNEDWSQSVNSAEGKSIPIIDLPFLRARTVWQGAIALNNGARQLDIPEIFRGNKVVTTASSAAGVGKG